MQAARGASLSPSDPDLQDQPAPRPHRPRRRCLLLFAAVAAAAYVLDVVSKVLAVAFLSDRAPVHVVGDFFTLTLTRNSGAAFSTATSYTAALTAIAFVAAVVVVWVARRVASPVWAVALGLLLAGVAGNLTDRLFRQPAPFQGHVVDFLAFPHWPVFNVADACINVAAALIIIQSLRGVRVNGTRTREESSRS
ncbi:MAG TPA: signal peptidase II [Nocardioidaceae bacterium]|nr:signal peptidase II [Nocardioidaceae bacterium]